MTLTLLPGCEQIVIAHLRAETELDALVGDRIGTRTPANAVYPRINVHVSGGAWTVRNWLTGARVQIDAWGATSGDVDAEKIARIVQSSLAKMAGTRVATGSFVTWSDQTLGISDQPDPDSGRPRYLQEWIVQAHPA